MKIGLWLSILFAVAIVTSMIGFIIGDFRQEYSAITVDSSWESKFNYIFEGSGGQKSLNRSIDDIKEDMEKMGEDEERWFAKLQGLAAIPNAMFKVAVAIVLSPLYLILMLQTINTELLHLPPLIAQMFSAFLIMAMVISLVEFWRRYKA